MSTNEFCNSSRCSFNTGNTNHESSDTCSTISAASTSRGSEPDTRKQQQARSKALSRQLETEESRQVRLRKQALRSANRRATETEQQAAVRRKANAIQTSSARAAETDEQRASRRQRNSRQTARSRSIETESESELRRERNSRQTARSRSMETESESEMRRKRNSRQTTRSRSMETESEATLRRQRDAEQTARSRQLETAEKTATRRKRDAEQTSLSRNAQSKVHRANAIVADSQRRKNRLSATTECLAFRYDPEVDYEANSLLKVGNMDVCCNFCAAKRWPAEAPSICCNLGKVLLPKLLTPPPPLDALFVGETSESKEFLAHANQYNSCFQMTSFGASKIISHSGYNPSYIVQGQVYHTIGSLMPYANKQPEFLQIYFIVDKQQQCERRLSISEGLSAEIIHSLQEMLHQNNPYASSFRNALDNPPSDQFKIVIHADKVPAGEHPRRFNDQSASEVAVLLGNQTT